VNVNFLHNILNGAIAVLATAIVFDWSVIVSAPTAATIVGILSTAKLVINAIRDGFAGMTQPQPPVKPIL
jgi:H+/gluconate symporter-like permease